MKKIILFLLIILTAAEGNACDICGCGTGSGYIGILPDFNKRIFGLRFRMNTLRTHIGVGGSTTHLTTTERYQIAEFWGAFNITPKTRILFSLPYNFNEKHQQSGKSTKNGLGDISVYGSYNILSSRKPAFKNKLLAQSLWIGGGIKLPAGKYQQADRETTAGSANIFQLGTGSTDFMLTAMYDIRLQDMGLNINSSYKMNTANKHDYRYGNKLNIHTQLYHKFRLNKRSSISPSAGMLFENSKRDREDKYPMDISGGQIWMGTIGSEFSYKKIMAGFNWQTALQQELASGMVKSGDKWMLHVAIAL